MNIINFDKIMAAELREKVKEVMSFVLKMQNISDEIEQANCDKWDSLRHLNLIVELEDVFDISFDPEEIAKMKDLDSICEIVKKKT